MPALKKTFYSFLLIVVVACAPRKRDESNDTKDIIPFAIIKIFPHDKTAFTQGLTVADGRLFESTGQDNSWIAEVDIATGAQEKKVTLGGKYFWEGITTLNNRIYQQTWKSNSGIIYE